MKVLIDKSFGKDIESVDDKKILHTLVKLIEKIGETEQISQIHNCKKLKGTKNAYRIRLGDYRIGFVFNGQDIEFIRFLHRKDIYNYFPE